MIHYCLNPDPKQRPTVFAVLEELKNVRADKAIGESEWMVSMNRELVHVKLLWSRQDREIHEESSKKYHANSDYKSMIVYIKITRTLNFPI